MMEEWYWWIETDECQKFLRITANNIFKDKTDAEEAMEYACKTVLNRCRTGELVMEPIPKNANELTQGQKAFLLTVLANEMHDLRRKRYGRPRPPQWIKNKTCRLLWEETFTQLCIMKRLIVEVFEVLKQQQEFLKEFLKQQQQNPNQKYTSKKLDDMVRQQCEGQNLDVMVREILHRVRGCRKPNIIFIPLDNGNENTIIDTIPDPNANIEYESKQECKESILTWLKQLIEQNTTIPPPLNDTCIQHLKLILKGRNSNHQLIVLRLLYQDNLTLDAAARTLSLTKDQVRYAKDQALQAIRHALQQIDIDNKHDIES